MTRFLLFDDDAASQLLPLTLTRPVRDLRVGALTISEKWGHALGHPPLEGPVAAHLSGVFAEPPATPPTWLSPQRPIVWINARFLPEPRLLDRIRQLTEPAQSGHPEFLKNSSDTLIAAACTTAEDWAAWLAARRPVLPRPTPAHPHGILDHAADPIEWPWDLLERNETELLADLSLLGSTPSREAGMSPAATVQDPDRLYMHPTAIIEPGCHLITEDGPISLGPGARIMAGSLIRGPFHAGENAVVKMGAKIYKGTTIGPSCKIGGEINNCIFHSNTNKGHDGYVGNSIFGEWINLGADTNASNLKNHYGGIHITEFADGRILDTGRQFLGTIMGDHTRAGINTMFNTGTICGVSAMVYNAGFPPRHIPSFSWVDATRATAPGSGSGSGSTDAPGIAPYHLDRALESMRRMMERKGVPFTRPYQTMMEAIFAHRDRPAALFGP